ncbi:1-acyl-sn-glycerol-3-phosphate acyltransferase, partial [Acinetobacter baumannii]
LRVYYPNHRSHGDFVLVWSMLPRAMRKRTRPVAGSDSWLCSAVRRYVINRVFRGVLVDRQAGRSADPIGVMGQVLA